MPLNSLLSLPSIVSCSLCLLYEPSLFNMVRCLLAVALSLSSAGLVHGFVATGSLLPSSSLASRSQLAASIATGARRTACGCVRRDFSMAAAAVVGGGRIGSALYVSVVSVMSGS